ncbi:MAG: hypothetical protein WBD20_25635 [Pirellulaceae bacterium]
MTSSPPRLLSVDENIRGSGGHYLELASLLIDGAKELGYLPTLGVHQCFMADEPIAGQATPQHDLSSQRQFPIFPVFRSRRMNYWSLGVDGRSKAQRDFGGRPVGGNRLSRTAQYLSDSLSRRQRNPALMIKQWSDDFLTLLRQWQPQREDQILINTTDDFVMLALADAVGKYKSDTPLNLNAIFHFAVFASNQITPRARMFGQQVSRAVNAMSAHHVSLFATTQSLSSQLSAVGVTNVPVTYPTRQREICAASAEQPLKILMAGMPRAEKGRDQIPSLLAKIYKPFLAESQFRFSMQMRPKAWKQLIPKQLHDEYHNAVSQQHNLADHAGPLEIVSSDLPGQDYHEWLGTADVGLFLYDPVRYVARCSGVLLEMMVAGVPVIVPRHCWLHDQLELAGGDGAVGYSYQSIEEIPQLLSKIHDGYPALRKRAAKYAAVMAGRHTGANTLRAMDLPEITVQYRRAS